MDKEIEWDVFYGNLQEKERPSPTILLRFPSHYVEIKKIK